MNTETKTFIKVDLTNSEFEISGDVEFVEQHLQELKEFIKIGYAERSKVSKNYNTTENLYAHLDTSSVCNTGKVITNVFSTKKEVASA